jgi:hypothetical protein
LAAAAQDAVEEAGLNTVRRKPDRRLRVRLIPVERVASCQAVRRAVFDENSQHHLSRRLKRGLHEVSSTPHFDQKQNSSLFNSAIPRACQKNPGSLEQSFVLHSQRRYRDGSCGDVGEGRASRNGKFFS